MNNQNIRRRINCILQIGYVVRDGSSQVEARALAFYLFTRPSPSLIPTRSFTHPLLPILLEHRQFELGLIVVKLGWQLSLVRVCGWVGWWVCLQVEEIGSSWCVSWWNLQDFGLWERQLCRSMYLLPHECQSFIVSIFPFLGSSGFSFAIHAVLEVFRSAISCPLVFSFVGP